MKKLLFICLVFLFCGCMPRIELGPGLTDPLTESVISGSGSDKILIIPVKGIINDDSKSGFMSHKPGLLQQIKSRLDKAKKDSDVKAVILKIDSPGGSACISDIIYNEIVKFKKETKKTIISVFMNVAASGGYYIAIPSDYIFAHPTSVTGSIGAVAVNLRGYELLGKLGIGVDVTKSGKNKDIGSPFRKASKEEKEIIQGIIDSLASRFLKLVYENRNIKEQDKNVISTARVFTAKQALSLNLIDEIGYFDDAVEKVIKLNGLSSQPKLIFYKRKVYPNENIYNNASLSSNFNKNMLLNTDLREFMNIPGDGFFYLFMD